MKIESNQEVDLLKQTNYELLSEKKKFLVNIPKQVYYTLLNV